MANPGNTRAAGYLTAGVALLVLVGVFLPMRIGREGRGDSLDPRSWRKPHELGDRDAEFLAGGGAGGGPREKGVKILVRPKGAEDHHVEIERPPDYPLAPPAAVKRTCAALREKSHRADPLPPACADWESGTVPPAGASPPVAEILEDIARDFGAATGIAVDLDLDLGPWDELSDRTRARLVALLPVLRDGRRADAFLEALADSIGARAVVTADGHVLLAGPDTPVKQDAATRRWANLQRARDLPQGEEAPPVWRSSFLEALRALPVSLEAENQPLDELLPRIARATDLHLFLDEALPPEIARRKTSWRVQNLPLEGALRLLLEPIGLDMVVERDALVVMEAAQAKARQEALEFPYRSAQQVLERRVELASADLVPRKLVAAIEQSLGVTVVVDETLWKDDKPLALPAGPRPLAAALDELARRNRLTWRMLDGEVYLLR